MRYVIAARIYRSGSKAAELTDAEFQQLLSQLGLTGIASMKNGQITVSRASLSQRIQTEFLAAQKVKAAA